MKILKNDLKICIVYEYLRSRKHFQCFYRITETRVEFGSTRNAVGIRAAGELFHGLFVLFLWIHMCRGLVQDDDLVLHSSQTLFNKLPFSYTDICIVF